MVLLGGSTCPGWYSYQCFWRPHKWIRYRPLSFWQCSKPPEMCTRCSLHKENAQESHATWHQHKDAPKMRTTTFILGDQMVWPLKIFIFLMTIMMKASVVGLKAWRISFRSNNSGQPTVWMHNAKASSVYLARQTVAAAALCLLNQTSLLKNLISRNWSHLVVIFVIFTQNTTVNLILLHSTGELQSFAIGAPQRQPKLMRCKKIS